MSKYRFPLSEVLVISVICVMGLMFVYATTQQLENTDYNGYDLDNVGNLEVDADIDAGGDVTVVGTVQGGTVTDGTTTITGGNYTGVGNITGSDVDISAGTGDFTTTGTGSFNNVEYPTINTAQLEPSGFVNTTDSTLSFENSTRVFTITPAVTSFDYYYAGVKTVISSSNTRTIANLTAAHWIYYNSSGTLTSSTTTPSYSLPMVAVVYWNTDINQGLLQEDRHGLTMDWHTHTLEHFTVGVRYEEGLTGTFNNTTFTVTAGIINDEDIPIVIAQQTKAMNLYKDGSANFQWNLADTFYYVEDAGTLQYNNGNVLTPVTNNKYIAQWIFGTNDTLTPIYTIMGQRQDTTPAQARENNKLESLTFGSLPSQEMKILYRVILRNQAGTTTYIEVQDLRAISNVPAGTFIATAHNVLTLLAWLVSGHTGTASTFAGFDSNGSAAEYTESNYLLADGTRALTGNWNVGAYNITTASDFYTSDHPYSAEWDGEVSVPTKNAVYDKIETLTGLWVLDINGYLVPSNDNNTDQYWELDGNDYIVPKA